MSANPVGTLAHVGVVMDDLDAGRRLFHEKLALPIAEYPDSAGGPAFAVRAGQSIIRVASAQSADARMGRRGVSHVAFKVDSLAKARERLAIAGVSSRPSEPVGSASSEVFWSEPKSTIGIPLQFAETDIKLDFREATKPKFIERMDHLGIACHSGDKARQIY